MSSHCVDLLSYWSLIIKGDTFNRTFWTFQFQPSPLSADRTTVRQNGRQKALPNRISVHLASCANSVQAFIQTHWNNFHAGFAPWPPRQSAVPITTDTEQSGNEDGHTVVLSSYENKENCSVFPTEFFNNYRQRLIINL